MSTDTQCTLRLVRGPGFADRLRRYKILLNGAQVATIPHDTVMDLQVPSGSLMIEARLDWGRSQPLTIEALAGRTIQIEVSNYWGAFLAFWGITFGFRTYLILKRLPA